MITQVQISCFNRDDSPSNGMVMHNLLEQGVFNFILSKIYEGKVIIESNLLSLYDRLANKKTPFNKECAKHQKLKFLTDRTKYNNVYKTLRGKYYI
jgi:hypothetical protein